MTVIPFRPRRRASVGEKFSSTSSRLPNPVQEYAVNLMRGPCPITGARVWVLLDRQGRVLRRRDDLRAILADARRMERRGLKVNMGGMR